MTALPAKGTGTYPRATPRQERAQADYEAWLDGFYRDHPLQDPYRRLAAAILLQGLRDWLYWDEHLEDVRSLLQAAEKARRRGRRLKVEQWAHKQERPLTYAHRLAFLCEHCPPQTLPRSRAAAVLGFTPEEIHTLYVRYKANPIRWQKEIA